MFEKNIICSRSPLLYINTHKGSFTDLFHTLNIYKAWPIENDWLQILYYDCKAKKSMKTYGRENRIEKGEVLDLVLHYQQDNGNDASHYYAVCELFCGSDKLMVEMLRHVKALVLQAERGGDPYGKLSLRIKNGVEQLTRDLDKCLIFAFDETSVYQTK